MTKIIAPRISEKAYAAASADKGVYTFILPLDVNKHELKKSVQSQYDVTVVKVNVSILKGKKKRFTMKRGKQSIGTRANLKKAYVTLKDGDVIPVFAGDSEEAAPAKEKK